MNGPPYPVGGPAAGVKLSAILRFKKPREELRSDWMLGASSSTGLGIWCQPRGRKSDGLGFESLMAHQDCARQASGRRPARESGPSFSLPGEAWRLELEAITPSLPAGAGRRQGPWLS